MGVNKNDDDLDGDVKVLPPPPHEEPQVVGIDDDELNKDNEDAANEDVHEALENEGLFPGNDKVKQVAQAVPMGVRRSGRVPNTQLWLQTVDEDY